MIERSHFKTQAEYETYLKGRKMGAELAKLALTAWNAGKQAPK